MQSSCRVRQTDSAPHAQAQGGHGGLGLEERKGDSSSTPASTARSIAPEPWSVHACKDVRERPGHVSQKSALRGHKS